MRKVLLIMTLLLTMVAQGAWADGTIDITPSDKNKVLCTDGSIYNSVSAAEADSKTPVAKIIVVDTENHKGLALALSDEGQMEYNNAQNACENKNTSTPVTNATWAIPSKDEWDQMITAAGSYTALRDGFSGIGGTNISSVSMEEYWTRTRNMEYPNLVNWTYDFSDNYHGWKSSDQGGTAVHVRFCLQFNIPIPTHNAALADGTPTGWSITPTTPEEGSTVTVSYTGQHRVKSVRVKKASAVPVTAITLNKTETSIEVGSTETLSVTAVAPGNATDKTYTWKTSDETKATVDQDGKVTAVAAGTVTIYAEANDGSGVKGNCSVTVTPATITVTWNSTNVFNSGNEGVTISNNVTNPNNYTTATFEGVTISITGSGAASHFYLYDELGSQLFVNGSQGGAYTFTAPSGKIFTKIEIINSVAATFTAYGDWTKPENKTIMWSGAASNTVTLAPPSPNNVNCPNVTSIVFTMMDE